MSIDLLYPDNRDRGRRVDMLCTQITTIQSQVTLSYGGTKDQEPKIKEKVDEILKHNGVKTVKELKDKLQDTLPEDVKKKYEDLIKKYENETVALGDVTDVITCITAVSGATAGGAKAIEFIGSSDLILGASYLVRALVHLTGDGSEAARLLKLGLSALKSFLGGINLSEQATKALKLVKLAGEVITAVGVVLDGILVIIAAIKGDEQRTQLRNAIHDLMHRRLITEIINKISIAYAEYIGGLYTICVRIKNHPDSPQVWEEDIKDTVNDLKSSVNAITFDQVWLTLADLDKKDHAWINEDPSRETVKQWWDTKDDPKKFNPNPN